MALGGSAGSGTRAPATVRRVTLTPAQLRAQASAANRGPQSEGRFTEFGWNSPVHNAYVAAAPAYNRAGYEAAVQAIRAGRSPGTLPVTPTAPNYGGGGGRGYGGGGGGGGGAAASSMTQAMFDAMLRAIGTAGPGLTLSPLALQQVDLPDFQGQALGAFNAQPYTQALGNIDTAVTADQAASAAAGQAADAALRANYQNSYANAPVTQAPQAQQVGNALQATVGGGGQQAQVAAQSNQAAGSDQASFQNLLNVLAAADTQAQGSRLNQVALDQATAGRNINAQALGLRGGVNMAQSQAANQWQQAQAERDYQNALMQQQWQREEMQRNQDIANQQAIANQSTANQAAQGNWQQRNEMISNRLTPLLQLLQGGQGINTDALNQLLAQWGAA